MSDVSPGEYARRIAQQHPDWSNRRIADKYGINPRTVGRNRSDPPGTPHIGVDGKEYPALRFAEKIEDLDKMLPPIGMQPEIRAVIKALNRCSQDQRLYLWTKVFPLYRHHRFFSRRKET